LNLAGLLSSFNIFGISGKSGRDFEVNTLCKKFLCQKLMSGFLINEEKKLKHQSAEYAESYE
jgi:hypothetical protein